MDMHKCRLCFRKFMSGRALGGHMARSHFTKLPLPQKQIQEKEKQLVELTESTSTEFSLKDEEIGEKGVAYVLRENPKKSFKVIDPEFFDVGSAVVHDRVSEAETESEEKSTRRRSNGGKRMMEDEDDVASDEDVALLLLMLSRGELNLKLGGKVKHRCEICNKVFKSSQALGGHRVSHNLKNLGIKKRNGENMKQRNKTGEVKNKIHECPHCGRVFGSGQALGGHKRSHFLGSPTRKTTTITTGSCSSNVGESLVGFSNSEKFKDGWIDLNLPAPMDDDDDDYDYEEASAVYEAYY